MLRALAGLPAIILLTFQPGFCQDAPVRAPGATPHALSPRNANYSIDVTLDPLARTLSGRETLEWTNSSGAAATELQFHLYYNAWRDNRSTWMRERLLGNPRSQLASRPERDRGAIDVSSLRITHGSVASTDLTSAIRYIAPDDGNADDRTVMAVTVPAPVQPGQTVAVEIAWTSRIPRTFARTGAIGDFFFLAHWFPKIGVQETTGVWNCHQFHSGTEFFSDYGVYDVRMTIPRGWILGATGQERERKDNPDGTTTHRYYQEDVHDFAWTTSPDYVERIARFDGSTSSPQAGSTSSPQAASAGPRSLPSVEMRLLLQPEHLGQEERHFVATRAALRYYGEWYGPYPYGHITIVDPAWQSGAGGMEYPTLLTAGTSWLNPAENSDPEDVTVHEAGHQFWYGIVGSNEFEDAWIDEGINTFSTARVIEEALPHFRLVRTYFNGFVPWVIHDVAWTRIVFGNRLAGYRAGPTTDDQATPSFRYWPAGSLATTYAKTAIWLHTLEKSLGWPTVQRMLSTFFSRWQFRHPKAEDFFRIANEASGLDLTPFFDQVYRGSVTFDYGVQSLSSEGVPLTPSLSPAGGEGGRRPGEAGQLGQPEAGKGLFRTDVVVRRHGDGIFPVTLLVTFDDGQHQRASWDGVERWKLITLEHPARAVSAQVDPDRVLLLDTNFTNNSFTTRPQAGRAATKWSLTWMVWLQDLLLTWAFFV